MPPRRRRVRPSLASLVCLVSVLGGAAAPSSARADDGGGGSGDGLGPLGGRVMSYLRLPVKDAAVQQASTSVWLELKPRLGPSYARFVGIADGFAISVAGGKDLRFRLREGYAGIGNEKVDFRVGYQVIPWGNADGVNPTDFLTARDLGYFSADPEANRLGVLSARLTWSPLTWLSVEIVGTPLTPVTTLLIPTTLLPAGLSSIPTASPSASLANIEAGARVTVSYRRWDLSLIGFRGFNHMPELALRGQRADGSFDIALVQHGYLACGLYSSVSAAGFVFRLESAYVKTENDNGRNPLIQPTHWDGVLGVERGFFDQRLRVQAQGIARVHPRYAAPSTVTGPDAATTATLVAVASANSILQNYLTRVRVAASLRLAWTTSDDKFSVEVFGVLNLVDNRDYLVRPLAAYRPTDALKLEIGAEIYGGPSATQLGALSPFNGVFTQATYMF